MIRLHHWSHGSSWHTISPLSCLSTIMAVQTIYSNKDSRVYKSESLIVPPTLPTGEAPLELNQPNMILDAKYNYRLIQLSAIVKITNILQPIINQNIDEYVTLCRRFGNKEEHPKIDYLLGEERNLWLHAENVYWKINERTLEVRIPLDALRISEAIIAGSEQPSAIWSGYRLNFPHGRN